MSISNFTLTMIKPDAVSKGLTSTILKDITDAGFKIIALKLTSLTLADAQRFYSIHQGKPFYEDLINFMSSGPIVAAVLKKENAVASFRKLVGSTNPDQAEEGTLRKKYAENTQQNAIHGSDSDENASIEIQFHFSDREIFYYL
jgi:nucleoside-diphosphate kinase